MKKFLRKSFALALALVFVCGSFSVSAVNVNGKEHFDYGSYVLLGDSVASGWSDIEHRDTFFKRVEGSYGALLADDLEVDFEPYAGLAFRTVEMRYIFEDDYEGDEFLFYSVDKEDVDAAIPDLRKAVSEAGIITLNVGGNDWGSYVGWYIERAMAEMEGTENFVEKALPYLEGVVNFGVDTIEDLIGIADLAQCVPELVQVLPLALEKGFSTYVQNWNIMIDDIYALNPDVTLVVIGMFDNSLQDSTMDGKENNGVLIPSVDVGFNVAQTIVDLANIPMREGAEKYGYIFVDPVGTLCEQNHPSYAGHRHIADMVLAALPDAAFPYTDIENGTKEYTVAQKLYTKGYMMGVSATEFAPDAGLTAGQLADVLYKVAGEPETAEGINDSLVWAAEKNILKAEENGTVSSDAEISRFDFAQSMFRFSQADGFTLGGFIKGLRTLFSVIVDKPFSAGKAIARIDAAAYIVTYCGF